MPIYEYKCVKSHVTTRVVIRPSENEPIPSVKCEHKVQLARTEDYNGNVIGETIEGTCYLPARLVPSRTGTPRLKAGRGGFYKPNA
jgi:hypothetical protein